MHQQQGRDEQAQARACCGVWERAVEVNPCDVDTLSSLGSLHKRQGQHEEARPMYERALAVDPRHVSTLYTLGKLHFQQGRDQQAQPLLRVGALRWSGHWRSTRGTCMRCSASGGCTPTRADLTRRDRCGSRGWRSTLQTKTFGLRSPGSLRRTCRCQSHSPPQPVRFPAARTEVVMRGLSTRPELNGRCGVVRSFDTERGRCEPSNFAIRACFRRTPSPTVFLAGVYGRYAVEVEGEERPLNLRPESLMAVEGGLGGGEEVERLRDVAVLL